MELTFWWTETDPEKVANKRRPLGGVLGGEWSRMAGAGLGGWRDQVPCSAGRFFTIWAPEKPQACITPFKS